jgi:hypothetical protein
LLFLLSFAPNNQGAKATLICSKEYEESNPYAQQTYEVMANTEMETSLSSNLHPYSYHVHSQTNSAQASECEEAELGIFFLGFPHSINDLKCFTFAQRNFFE